MVPSLLCFLEPVGDGYDEKFAAMLDLFSVAARPAALPAR
jgi:hypothetical protein